jgi:hypothetical protein
VAKGKKKKEPHTIAGFVSNAELKKKADEAKKKKDK